MATYPVYTPEGRLLGYYHTRPAPGDKFVVGGVTLKAVTTGIRTITARRA
jgi:hypothetical protein